MTNNQALCLATAILFYAGNARSQEVVAIPPGQDEIVPVKKGEPSPFDGQLFDNPTSLRWANWLMQYKNLVKNTKELDQTVCAADTDLAQKKIDLLQKQYDDVTADLQKKLDDAQAKAANPPWYDSMSFGVAVGVVGTVAVGVLSAALISAVK